MDELLVKYILGETTTEENQQVNNWIAQSNANRKYYEDFKLLWNTSKTIKVESKLDPEQSWQAFKQKATQATDNVRPLHRPVNWLRIAAILLITITAGGVLYRVLKPATPIMLTAQTSNNTRVDTLVDGSIITLNKNSILVYPNQFAGNTREIKLVKGEAFFDIAPDKSKPFIIKVNDVAVKVVGTSFNIKSNNNRTEVIVETGIVQVIRKEVVIKLKPKEKAEAGKDGVKKLESDDMLYNYYRTGEFQPNNTPLWRLVDILNEAYHTNIVIGNKALQNQTITTTLKYGSLDDVLKVICKTFNAHARKAGNKIIIE